MRNCAMYFVVAFVVSFLFTANAEAQPEQSSAPAMAPFSAANAIPVVAEIEIEQLNEILLPTGWFFVQTVSGGYLLEHEDGSRALIMRCVQADHYQVAWRITYERDGMQCTSANVIRVNETLPNTAESDAVTLHITAPSECIVEGEVVPTISENCTSRLPATALNAPWPASLVQTFLEALNPQTRRGICSR